MARKQSPSEKKAKTRESVVKRKLAARDRPKDIRGLTDKRDDPDRMKKKQERLTHGRRRVADQNKAIKSQAPAGSKVNPNKARRSR